VAFTSLHCIRGLLRGGVLAERLRRQRSGRGCRRVGRANRSCQFANSPRHDEHVIYEIAEDNGAAGKLKIEGYKIVNSAKQWMGTLLCNYRSADHVLTCAPKEGKPRDWTFQIKDGAMSETLVLPEDRTLHRKMSLQRIRKSA
jgi:hypothetical protein